MRAYVKLVATFSVLVCSLSAEPSRPVTPASVSQKMAQHLFQSSGSSILLRSTDKVAECRSTETGDGVWVVAPQDVVTEFLYSPQTICVSVFVRSDRQAPDTTRLDQTQFESKFGSIPTGEFSVRQRLAFVFPRDSSNAPGPDALALFFRKIARPVNLQHPGSLTSAMKEIQSPEAGAQFAGDLLGDSPRSEENESQEDSSQHATRHTSTPITIKAAILAISISILGAALFLFFRSRSYARRAEAEKLALLEKQLPVKTPAPKPAPNARDPAAACFLCRFIRTPIRKLLER